MRVIVLDDDKDLREMLKTALTAKGHDVQAYSDPTQVPFFHGNDCPCKPEQSCTDILLADIVMPQMEGIDLMRKLKEDGCWPMSLGNVAVMSGYLTLHYMNELHELGIHYFRKPFELEAIYAWIDQCAEKSQDSMP
jgi:DNA-binding response OmpR family regulator